MKLACAPTPAPRPVVPPPPSVEIEPGTTLASRNIGDSDDETDKVNLPAACVRGRGASSHPAKQIVVNSASYTTYRALLVYLHSGYISFARLAVPTRPANSITPSAPTPANTDLPLPASPKSMYALAHLLELPIMMRLALENFKSQLTADNVLYQLASDVAVHDEIKDAITVFAKANWVAVKASKAATELSKPEVLEAMGCEIEVMGRFVELMSKC